MEIPTALSLELTRRLFDTDVPLEVLDELRPGRIVRFHLEAMDPVAALMSQRLTSGPTKYRLLRFWLTSGLWRRIHLLLTTLVPSKHDHFEDFRSGRPGLIDRIARLAKLVVLESSLLAQGTLSKLGLRKEAQTRFWSSHASSSERR
jgi:transposase